MIGKSLCILYQKESTPHAMTLMKEIEFMIGLFPGTQDRFIYILDIVQILVHSHFDLVSLLLTLEATELLSELVTQMALKLINNYLISVQQKR